MGQTESFAYDAAGNQVRHTDFNGSAIAFDYDERNRLSAEHYPDGTSLSYTYTPTGQRATERDARGVTVYVYDTRDRLFSRTEPDGRSISYTYDNVGNRLSISVASSTTNYAFDALNRVVSVTSTDAGLTQYQYDLSGNLAKAFLPNNILETRQYDDLNRLISVEDNGPAGAVARFQYTLNSVGQRTSVVEQNGRRVDYAYDGLRRLITETMTDPMGNQRTVSYSYDSVGNRRARNDSSEGLTTYQYDDNDRLIRETVAGQDTQFTYDANGNMLSRVQSAVDQIFLHYDFENRVSSADVRTSSGTTHFGYRYNADGIRVSQSIDGEETRYLVDANRPYAEVLEEYAPDSHTAASYTYGIDLIAQERGAETSFYVTDGLGSARALTNGSGEITDQYAYDAFGQLLAQSGSTANAYLFAGEPLDSATGLYYFRARYYLPEFGRFASRDPNRGRLANPVSFHPYLYADADPVNRLDPSGRMTLAEQGFVTAIANTLEGFVTNVFRSTVQRVAVQLGRSVGTTILRRLIGQIAGREIAQTEIRLLVRSFVRDNLIGNLRGVVGEGLKEAAENLIKQGFVRRALVEAIGQEATRLVYIEVLDGIIDGFLDIGITLVI
jgi:RHS repeat-associated protein